MIKEINGLTNIVGQRVSVLHIEADAIRLNAHEVTLTADEARHIARCLYRQARRADKVED